jgi:hypothetical protein
MMKKVLELSLLLGLVGLVNAVPEAAAGAAGEQTPQAAAGAAGEQTPQAAVKASFLKSAAMITGKVLAWPFVKTWAGITWGANGVVAGTKACGKGIATGASYAGNGVVDAAKYCGKHYVITSATATVLGLAVLYNTNEGFRNWLFPSDDEAPAKN